MGGFDGVALYGNENTERRAGFSSAMITLFSEATATTKVSASRWDDILLATLNGSATNASPLLPEKMHVDVTFLRPSVLLLTQKVTKNNFSEVNKRKLEGLYDAFYLTSKA